jgi:hypothetical protein
MDTTQSTTTAATSAATTTQPADLKPLAQDVQDDIALIVSAVKAYKAGGASALTQQAPNIVAAVEKDFEDVKTALPAIKAGYKTTEFWLIVAFLLGNAAYIALAGKTLPIDVDAVLATVLSIYASLRHVAKQSTQ